ncbi:MAG: hypothetical protein LBG64_04580, partial [Pseudomonadales bacterium]|nr:hypothetical protein [Pseudomonadales bacterium]
KVVNICEIKDFAFSIPVVPWNKIYRRDFLVREKIVFPKLAFHEDLAFFLELIVKAKKIAFLDEFLTIHRINIATSLNSNQTRNENWQGGLIIYQETDKRITKLSSFKEIENEYLMHKMGAILNWYQRTTEPQQELFFYEMKPMLKQAYEDFDLKKFSDDNMLRWLKVKFLAIYLNIIINNKNYHTVRNKLKCIGFLLNIRHKMLMLISNVRR